MWCEPVRPLKRPSIHACPPALCGCSIERRFTPKAPVRKVLPIGTGPGAAPPAVQMQAQSGEEPGPGTGNKPHRIDVHHHFFPPFLKEAWKAANLRVAPVASRWTLDATLDQMNQGGVATAVLSLATGGLNLPNLSIEEHRRLARLANEYMAKARADHPGRFGQFGFTPMPDVEGTLQEIEYALDVLKADGIGLHTSYGQLYLGDEAFKPVLEELNRRKAVVYVHPNRADCCDMLKPYVPESFTEYPQDTNRTVMSLLFGGAFTRTRDVRWIFSHAGAAVPLLAGRVKSLSKIQVKNAVDILPDGVDFELKRLHFETANAAYAPNMAALLSYVPSSQVMFGSDYPYVTVVENVEDLLKLGLSAADLAAIERGTALRLMPALKIGATDGGSAERPA